jgi:hypothetical protein
VIIEILGSFKTRSADVRVGIRHTKFVENSSECNAI